MFIIPNIVSLFSLSQLAFPGVCVYVCVFFFFKEQALGFFQSSSAFQLWSVLPWEADLGGPPSGVTVGQPVVMIEGMSSRARWSEFKCSFLYLLAI